MLATSLPAALQRLAASDPESPCVFWPEGWNWRWWSWRQLAELAARWSASFAGLPAAAAVGFAGDSYPQAIPLDLAVQAAGLTPVPLLSAGGAMVAARAAGVVPPGCAAWVEAVGGEVRVTRLGEAAAGEAAAAGRAGDPEALVTGGAGFAVDPGAPVFDSAGIGAGGAGKWLYLSQAELLAAVARVESAIGVPAGRRRDSRDREILVAGWPLGRWEARLLGAWALAAGAALVLEPDPARRSAAVTWARPTVFYGTAAEVAALRRQAAARGGAALGRRWELPRHPGRRLPPPLRRLRALLQDEAPAPADAAFWEERGVRQGRLPGLSGDGN